MTIEEHQELHQDMQELADRAGTCANPTDRQVMSKAVGHLLNYFYAASKDIEE